MTRAVRGAIQVEKDTRDAIWDAASLLVSRMMEENRLSEAAIVSLLFSVTRDLRSANPAAGVRRQGFSGVPLFCLQEAEVDGGMPRVIRALLTYTTRSRSQPVPVYLGGAGALRPDLPATGPAGDAHP